MESSDMNSFVSSFCHSTWCLLHAVVIFVISLFLLVFHDVNISPLFIYSTIDGYLSCVLYLNITNSAACTCLLLNTCMYFCWICICLGGKLLDHRVYECSAWVNCQRFSQSDGTNQCFHYQYFEIYNCSISSPTLGIACLFHFNLLVDMQRVTLWF